MRYMAFVNNHSDFFRFTVNLLHLRCTLYIELLNLDPNSYITFSTLQLYMNQLLYIRKQIPLDYLLHATRIWREFIFHVTCTTSRRSTSAYKWSICRGSGVLWLFKLIYTWNLWAFQYNVISWIFVNIVPIINTFN